MFSAAWKMLKDTVLAFINDEALSRGAAIAFYTVTSIAPVLLIVVAIAGLAFGRDAAQNAITEQLSGLMGRQTAEVLQTAVASAASKSSGVVATIIGIITLMVTASGVFGEMQTALNVIWKAKPEGTTVSRLIRARAASLRLVAALGFLLMVSLVVSTLLTAFGNYLNSILPFGQVILTGLNVVVSLVLISFLFAAIYKVLPDRDLEWGDVVVGAIVTGVLFTVGKSLISWYDLLQGFRTTNYVRDWLPIRREQCAKRVSRKSRWSQSSARQIASRCRLWPSGMRSANRRSIHGASVSAAFK